jgi:hypothetical protein
MRYFAFSLFVICCALSDRLFSQDVAYDRYHSIIEVLRRDGVPAISSVKFASTDTSNLEAYIREYKIVDSLPEVINFSYFMKEVRKSDTYKYLQEIEEPCDMNFLFHITESGACDELYIIDHKCMHISLWEALIINHIHFLRFTPAIMENHFVDSWIEMPFKFRTVE